MFLIKTTTHQIKPKSEKISKQWSLATPFQTLNDRLRPPISVIIANSKKGKKLERCTVKTRNHHISHLAIHGLKTYWSAVFLMDG